jgi:hypothetical protein
MSEAAEPDKTGADAKKKRSILGRIPTPLVVTLVGIALTAWLLPAITRQWDDRQKANEVKSGIVADIAAASAHALTGGEAIWAKRPVNASQVADQWSLASMQIQSQLRAYFSDEVVHAWQVYAWMISKFDASDSGIEDEAFVSATRDPITLNRHASNNAAAVLITAGNPYGSGGPRPSFKGRGPDEISAVARLRAYIQPSLLEFRPVYGGGSGAPRDVEYRLLAFEQEIAAEVLAGHVSGFSTSGLDLVHDLIP